MRVSGNSLPADYVERVYAGWLGKVIGVRHGSNIEGWSYDRIAKTYGEMNGAGYLFDFKNFAADDDTNGPLFFLRSLADFTFTREITPKEMGLTWLNYVPDHHGFFWWGGYGKSTEHTAYENLKNGIPAPRSGSIEQNGATVAEQIGGQIFIDVWGMIAPGQPELAAEYAGKMASVSHDGNGKFGGMFIAACVAEAFFESDMNQIIEAGLSVIPADCEYTRMVRDVMGFYQYHRENWREGFRFVYENYGYDRYPGNCHIIPNSAVIVLALLYSEGNFSRAINIANMCGWDTDCNVGNVGAIMGVRNGLEAIDAAWREPIRDFLCCSSVIGTLNLLDIPWCASFIANFGYKIAGMDVPKQWADQLNGKSAKFHFEFPGSTHAFRLDCDVVRDGKGRIENTSEHAASGERSLLVEFDNVQNGIGYRVYHQTYYEPEDFNDNRYQPSFSPIVYPGQTLSAKVMVSETVDGFVHARLYVKDGNSGTINYGEKMNLTAGLWTDFHFDIPSIRNACIREAGVEFIPIDQTGRLTVLIDDVDFTGKPDYEMDFFHSKMDVWTGLHQEVRQMTYLRGIWTLENGELSGSYSGEPAECYTGDLGWTDYHFSGTVIPKLGGFHNLQFRVQGAMKSYAVGLAEGNKMVLYKNEYGYRTLCTADFTWKHHEAYTISIEADGNRFKVYAGDEKILEYKDEERPYLNGQIGFSNFQASHTHYKGFSVKGI